MERIRVRSGSHVDQCIAETMASRVGEIINGYAVCNALFAFIEAGLVEELSEKFVLEPKEIAARRKLDPHQLDGLLRFLSLNDVFKERAGSYWITPTGRTLFSPGALAQLEIFRGGYGQVMFEAGSLLNRSKVYHKDLVRDGKYVASGSGGFSRSYYSTTAFVAIDRCQGKRVLDLGCGDANFLIDYCKRTPGSTGIGVDIDERAIATAKSGIQAAGLSDRIRMVQGDAFQPDVFKSLASEVDVVHSFGMQHELFRDGEQAVINYINEIASSFRGKYYVLGEPMLEYQRDYSTFYWAHVLSLQGFPRNIEGWIPLLERCQTKLEAVFYPDHERYGAFYLLKL